MIVSHIDRNAQLASAQMCAREVHQQFKSTTANRNVPCAPRDYCTQSRCRFCLFFRSRFLVLFFGGEIRRCGILELQSLLFCDDTKMAALCQRIAERPAVQWRLPKPNFFLNFGESILGKCYFLDFNRVFCYNISPQGK